MGNILSCFKFSEDALDNINQCPAEEWAREVRYSIV